MIRTKIISKRKLLLLAVLCFVSVISFAQSPTDSLPSDPGAMSVSTLQNMSFGTFIRGNTGGTVVVAPNGTRTATGTVVLLNGVSTFYQAIFEIEAPPGTIISILNGPDAVLTGTNSGTMSLHLNNTNPVSPFTTVVQPPGKTQVSLGGTLTVGNSVASPPGKYTGSFYITFNQE